MRNRDRETEGERDRESYTFSHSLTHSLCHSYSHSLIHSLCHSYSHLLTHPLSHSHTHSLTHSLTHALIHSPILLLTHSLNLCRVWTDHIVGLQGLCSKARLWKFTMHGPLTLSLSLSFTSSHSLRTVPHIPFSYTLSSSLFIHPISSQTHSLTLTLPLSLSLTVLIKRCGGSCRDHETNSNSHQWGNWQNRSEECVKK